MSLGLFKTGTLAQIPFQLLVDGISVDPFGTPVISKLVRPDGTIDPLFPLGMTKIDPGIFVFDYLPVQSGNYICTIDVFVDQEPGTLRRITEDFHCVDLVTTTDEIKIAAPPRVEPR